ncbi:lyase family protein [Escherichia coli]|nr:lyase family protein [Escherichia coli]
MTEIIGPVGGKLHTGRSRNDQTTVDSKMHMRAIIREIQEDITNLQKIIINKSRKTILMSSCQLYSFANRSAHSFISLDYGILLDVAS